jgi:hypothetical protein
MVTINTVVELSVITGVSAGLLHRDFGRNHFPMSLQYANTLRIWYAGRPARAIANKALRAMRLYKHYAGYYATTITVW